jgi:hypothetical protein
LTPSDSNPTTPCNRINLDDPDIELPIWMITISMGLIRLPIWMISSAGEDDVDERDDLAGHDPARAFAFGHGADPALTLLQRDTAAADP